MTIPIQYYIWDNATGEIVLSGKEYDSDALRAKATSTQTFTVVATGISRPFPGQHQVDPTTGVITVVTPNADDLRAAALLAKITELRVECQNMITSGFYSKALGTSYFYPSNDIDQMNLLHGSPVMCRDSNNVWAPVDHTDDQIEAVRAAFRSLRDTARTKLNTLTAEANAATTAADVNNIVWNTSA